MMRDKVVYIFAGVIVILIAMVVVLTNINTQKDGQIQRLKDKLETTEAVTDGINEGIDKLIQYNECTAKILIAPRDDNIAIQGSKQDPATALERCRLESNGETLPDNNSTTSPNPANTSNQNPPRQTSSPSGSGNQEDDTTPPSPSEEPEPPQSILPGDQEPIIGCPLGVCI